MTLYEINNAILSTLNCLKPNERGEISNNYEELNEQLEKLQMERQQKLENVAKYVLNVRGDIDVLKNEEQRLLDRRKVLEKYK